MRKFGIFCLLIFVTFSRSAFAVEDITVALFFASGDDEASIEERVLEAIAFQGAANQALINSGILDRKFKIQANILVSMSLDPPNLTKEEITDWMVDENQKLASVFKLARNNQFGINNGADLVLLRARDIKKSG